MMKYRPVALVCTCAVLIATWGPMISLATADTWRGEYYGKRNYPMAALRKGGRGVANVVTSPAELIRQFQRAKRHDGQVAAHTVGIANGFAWMFARIGVGVYEVLTFPLPFNNFNPVIYPEFVDVNDDWLAGSVQPTR
jgi:putative exosortase-associated protein (TIGR04073 family)